MQAVPLWGRVLPARLQEDPCPGRSTVPTARGHLENVHPPGRALHAATVDTAGDHNNTEYGDAAGPKDCLPYVTKMHLLFEPKAMDAWVTRRITTNDEGDYVDAQTGKPSERPRKLTMRDTSTAWENDTVWENKRIGWSA